MDYRKWHRLHRIIILVGAGIMFLGYFFLSNSIKTALCFVISGMFISIAGIIICVLNYRCPHCGGRLSAREKIPNYCPHCGKKLD